MGMTMIATQTEEEIQRQVRVIRDAARIIRRSRSKTDAFLRAIDPDLDKRKKAKKSK
jgi:hypothetical protein